MLLNVPLVLPNTLLMIRPLVENVILPVKNALPKLTPPNVLIVLLLLSSDLTHLNIKVNVLLNVQLKLTKTPVRHVIKLMLLLTLVFVT